MIFTENKAEKMKIAYVGGGSRGWAWGLMSDLASCEKISGDVYLYDIDKAAAEKNEIIGNKFNEAEGAVSHWCYHTCNTLNEALSGVDFVIISILPGTFDEMESDVHTPEKYGIYQSVGDTSGPGGIVRALRTIPMFEVIAEAIKKNCPDAWVINYTNPMTLCISALYRVFPEIKAFGCCHEVFGTQGLLKVALEEFEGITDAERTDIKVNVTGVNHFTWITSAQYKNIDLFPVYEKFCKKYHETGYDKRSEEEKQHWMNNHFFTSHKVKMDLFRRFGYIAAAGDRHLAEFCPGKWYLESPEKVHQWGFSLTPVSYRKNELIERLEKSESYVKNEIPVEIKKTGEEGILQICALLGLGDIVTNVNIPNVGQIPNLPLGAVVETNASFRSDSVTPVMAGNIPDEILPLVSRISHEQQIITEAIAERNLDKAFEAFSNDPLVTISHTDARKLFDEMIKNTEKYLTVYK